MAELPARLAAAGTSIGADNEPTEPFLDTACSLDPERQRTATLNTCSPRLPVEPDAGTFS